MEDLLYFMAQQSEVICTLQQQLVVQNTPKLEVALSVMNLDHAEWDYHFYQEWEDNLYQEWEKEEWKEEE